MGFCGFAVCARLLAGLLALRPFLLSRSSEVFIASFSGRCRILIALAVQGSGFGVAFVLCFWGLGLGWGFVTACALRLVRAISVCRGPNLRVARSAALAVFVLCFWGLG